MVAIMGACTTQRLGTSSPDDVYASPTEERQKAQAAAAERQRQEQLARQNAVSGTNTVSISDDSAASTETHNAAYYKDPQYSADDYYDYAYAARINRFSYPMGLGYYDNYYTNMYTYNNNPAYYGTSIYSNYGYGMPSSYASVGFGFGFGNGYGMYNSYYPFYTSPGCYACGYPACYSCGYGGFGYGYPYSGWGWGMGYPYGYSSYWNGYYSGYYNGLYSGAYSPWGYYNSFDVNSNYQQMSYGPRGSNTGGNARGRDGAIPISNEHQRYFENVAQQQSTRPRFTDTDRIMRSAPNNNGAAGRMNNGGGGAQNNGMYPDNRSGRSRSDDRIMQQQQNAPSRREAPTWNNNNGGFGGRDGGGGMSAPRGTGSGGGGRHR